MDSKQPKPRPSMTSISAPTPVVPKPSTASDPTIPSEDLPDQPSGFSIETPQKQLHSKRSRVLRFVLVAVAVVILTVATVVGWYFWAIQPLSNDTTEQTFVVASGETPSIISRKLEKAHLIRSAFAFELYAKLHKQADSLQAGSYTFSPNQSVSAIVNELIKGQSAVYNLLIPPGLTLKQLADPTVKSSFASQGFSAEEIQRAFSATYTSPLLKDKPVGASLEGYIYPETFQVRQGDSLESVLERSFDTFYERLQSDGMFEKFTAKGLTLHQALTLGSIIQKETSSADVQRQVAQVFLKRLSIGMMLGSDVTYMYAAAQLGVEATPTLDSPYNTRIHTGLPPGPIATMNYSTLQAITNPADGEYLYFVAGDDGTVHFSRTNEEHEQLVQQYCKKLCSASVQ